VAAGDLDPNSSVVYIAMSLLCSRQNSLPPELLYLFSPQQIISFIKIFSGETLKVPTVEEFRKDLMGSLGIYHVVIEGRSWDWFQLKYNLDGNYKESIRKRVVGWLSSRDPSERQFLERLRDLDCAREQSNASTESLAREINHAE
jgi:hypothetical protein